MSKTQNKIKLLIAEDDPNLGFVVKDSLEGEGYDDKIGRAHV